jgi:uncharacterized protein YhaN
MTDKEIREAREIIRKALEEADQATKQIKETLRISEERMAPVREDLRRWGYLR